jgi:hypothetical protein
MYIFNINNYNFKIFIIFCCSNNNYFYLFKLKMSKLKKHSNPNFISATNILPISPNKYTYLQSNKIISSVGYINKKNGKLPTNVDIIIKIEYSNMLKQYKIKCIL